MKALSTALLSFAIGTALLTSSLAFAAPTPKKMPAKKAPAPVSDDKVDSTSTVDQGGAVSTQQGGDTYNFYFQKAPGPQEVHQGGNAAPAPKVSTPKPEVSEPAEDTEPSGETRRAPLIDVSRTDRDERGFARVELSLGLQGSGDAGRTGGYLGALFNFNRHIGLLTQIFATAYSPDSSSTGTTMNDNGIYTTTRDGSSWGVLAALSVAPVVNDSFRLSILGGGLAVHDQYTDHVSNVGNFGIDSHDEQNNLPVKTTAIVGVDATVFVGRMLGLRAFGLAAADSKLSQLGLGAIVRF